MIASCDAPVALHHDVSRVIGAFDRTRRPDPVIASFVAALIAVNLLAVLGLT